MNVTAGDRLEPCFVFGRAGHGFVQDRLRGCGFIGQTGGDTGDQLREWVLDVTTIGDCQRAGSDREPCRAFDEVPTSERDGVGGDRGANPKLGVAGLDPRERAGQQCRWLPYVPRDDVDQRLGPRSVGLTFGPEPFRPGAIEDLTGLPAVTHDQLCRAPPRAAAPLPVPDQG